MSRKVHGACAWGAVVLITLILCAADPPAVAQDPAAVGEWTEVFDLKHPPPEETAVTAIHSILLPSGEVLLWGFPFQGVDDTGVWDPNGADIELVTPAAPPPGEAQNFTLFCAGHAYLADGRVLVMGTGEWARIFDADQGNLWSVVPDMHKSRFYPTATTLPDGRVLVISGSSDGMFHKVHEVFDPDTETWTTLDNAEKQLPLYPFMFVLEDGRVFFAGPYDFDPTLTPFELDPMTPGVLDVQDPDPTLWEWEPLTFQKTPHVGHAPGLDASAVMYAPGKVLVAGGPDGDDGQFSTWLIDLTKPQSEWNWESGPLMNHARSSADLVILADGRLFMVGGSSGELEPEWIDLSVLDPQWLPLAEMDEPRG